MWQNSATQIPGNAPNLYTRHQPATGNLFLQFLIRSRSLEFDLQNSEVVDSSFNYDNPCQDYLYPQDHTQTKFDATFDHFREHKTNSINEE